MRDFSSSKYILKGDINISNHALFRFSSLKSSILQFPVIACPTERPGHVISDLGSISSRALFGNEPGLESAAEMETL